MYSYIFEHKHLNMCIYEHKHEQWIIKTPKHKQCKDKHKHVHMWKSAYIRKIFCDKLRPS